MSNKEKPVYQPIPSNESDSDGLACYPEMPPRQQAFERRMKWLIVILSFLIVASNVAWAWVFTRVETPMSGPHPSTQMQVVEETFPPSRTILQPIYQDTEFNEEGDNKERADNLWKSLFPPGNGVLSLNASEAKSHGLHETSVDPSNEENGVYIIAGFHTMHCVTVLRTALWHYRLGEELTDPWSHLVHCLDMVRQTLMCNLDTTVMWTWDPDTFADGQLHVCKDYWQLHQWATEHAG